MSRNNRFETFNNVETFEGFFHGWLVREEQYTHELLQLVERINGNREEEDELRWKELIAHYKRSYGAKSKLTRENVFLVLSPIWCSSFELSFFWIAGFKPGLVPQLVTINVPDLSKEQWRRLEQVAAETGEAERELEVVAARVQETLTGPVVMEASTAAVNGECNRMELVIERLRSSMEELVECADYLRVKTVVTVMEILNRNVSCHEKLQ